MKKGLSICIAILALLSVVVQYYLMLKNSSASLLETSIRFFSFFTILSNSLVALYFISLSLKFFIPNKKASFHFGLLTAITVYITIVGLVYQLILRQTWSPTGLQKIVDELLHSVNPVLVILFWVLSIKTGKLRFSQISSWLIFPLVYLVYVLIRGQFSNFYPYPFLNIEILGFNQVMINSLSITVMFVLISALFVFIHIKASNKK